MDGIRLNRFAAASAFGALLLCLPIAAHAQDAQPSPTPGPVLTDPRIPSDFSLPSGDEAPQVVGPTRPGDAPPRETPLPQATPTPSPSASAARQLQPVPEVRRPAPTSTPTPRGDVPFRQPNVEDAEPPTNAPASTEQLPVDVPLPTDDAIPDQGAQSGPTASAPGQVIVEEESSFWSIAIALLLAVLAGLAVFVFLRKRGSAEGTATTKVAAPELERPVVLGREPNPQPAPTPAPVSPRAPAPALVVPSGLVQSRRTASQRRDDSGLVTVRSPNAPKPNGGIVTAPAPSNGLVTTNLAQKRRDQAEAQRQVKPPAPRPATIKRNISFDWS